MRNYTEPYQIIYADCPWIYNARNNKNTKFGLGMHRYSGMSLDKLCSYLIDNDIKVADNAALFLWATCPKLYTPKTPSVGYAGKVMESWGFRYATVGFTWAKTYPKKGTYFFGPGYYTASNVELCLLGIRGKMKPIDNTISQLVVSPISRHSEKPAEIHDLIVRLFGDLPRIELFARRYVDGWDATGDQLPILTRPLDYGIL